MQGTRVFIHGSDECGYVNN